MWSLLTVASPRQCLQKTKLVMSYTGNEDMHVLSQYSYDYFARIIAVKIIFRSYHLGVPKNLYFSKSNNICTWSHKVMPNWQ